MNQIDKVKDAKQEACDNLPKGLQSSGHGEAISKAIDTLYTAYSSVEEAKYSLEDAMQ